MGFRFLALLFLAACATKPLKDAQFSELWQKVSMQGKGKARLEVPPESWVFSFEAELKNNDWVTAITIPLHGEEIFSFPGLDKPQAEVVPAADDFRWRVVQSLRAASAERKLNYPQLGQDFVYHLHHILRWSNADKWGLVRSCDAVSRYQWNCRWDKLNSSWTWNERKEEFTGEFILRPKWLMRVVFKNLTDQNFKRVTLEIIRESESKQFVEMRQEFFFR
jgi:hypothetical protein